MRAYIRNTLIEYKAKLADAEEANLPQIRSEFTDWYNSVSDQDRKEMKPFWEEIKKEAWDIIAEIKEGLNELRALDEAELAGAKK